MQVKGTLISRGYVVENRIGVLRLSPEFLPEGGYHTIIDISIEPLDELAQKTLFAL